MQAREATNSETTEADLFLTEAMYVHILNTTIRAVS